MAPLTSSIEVAQPPEVVFAYATDPTRFAEWQEGVVGGHLVDGGTPRVGDTCMTTRKIGFAERRVTSRITQVDPPRSWSVNGVDGPIRATVEVKVSPLDGDQGSRLTISLDFEGHGLGKVLVPLLVRRQAGAEMPRNLKRLKDRLEVRC